MGFFRRMSIRKQMLLTFIPLALLPMLILNIIAYLLFSDRMEGYTGSQVQESVEQMSNHIDSYLDELERLSMLPYYQPTVLAVMHSQHSGDLLEQYYETKAVESLIVQSMINPREDLRDVFLYRLDGRVIFHSRYEAFLNEHYDFREAEWFLRALEGNGKAVFLGGYKDDRFMYPTDNILAVTRLIKSYDQKILGAILIDADFDQLASMFDEVNLGNLSNLIVLDQEQRVIYQQNDLYPDALEEMKNLVHKSGKRELKQGLFTAYSQSDTTGWTLIGMLPVHELNKEIFTMRNLIFLLLLLMIIGTVFASVYLSRGMTKPLIQLKKRLREIQLGNFKVTTPIPRNSNEEISTVLIAFNNMSQHIEDLIHQVADVKVRQKEAELNQLKAQIRPHFLYNTLESIRALAELKDNYDVAEVTSSLGNLLRYSIQSHNKLVRIGDELQQVHNYIRIQQICSRYPIRLIVDIDEAYFKAYTIPLLFQPIIENCIQHGFDGITYEGEIFVSAYTSGKDLLIEITDDGVGMSEAVTAQLNEVLSSASSSTSCAGEAQASSAMGMGILNVASRIELIFGEPYGILVSSTQGEGTTVFMRLPYMEHPTAETNLMLREGGQRYA